MLNTTDDDQASQLIFEKLRADDGVASGQNLGEIWFRGQDNAQNTEDYAAIIGEIDVSTGGQESGKLGLYVASHDGGNNKGLEIIGGSVDNEVDVTLGNGTASLTTIAGDLSITTGLILDSVDVTTIQTSGESFADNDTSLMTSAAINDRIESFGYGTGDITGVRITTDDGGSPATASSGSADFSLLGSNGVGITNSGGTTITAVAVPGEIDHDSLQNFVANEHLRWDNDVSSTATIHANNITDLHGAGVDGSANQLLTDDGDGTVTSESNLTFDGSTLSLTGNLDVEGDTITFQSDNADDPKIVIQNNTNNNQGARLQMKKNRGAAQVNGDNLAEMDFFGEDAGQNQAQYAKILIRADEVTDGQESGDFRVQVAAHDSSLTQGLKLVGGSASGEVDVTIAAGTASSTTISGDLTVTTDAIIPSRKFTATSSTHFERQGDVVYLGGGSTTQGELCYLKSDGEWAAADADATGTAGGVLLALALGTDPDVDGMLLRGMFTLDHDPGTIGDELYVSTTAGDITGTVPTGSGDIVRVVGYCLDSTNGQIWFNPSNDFIVLA